MRVPWFRNFLYFQRFRLLNYVEGAALVVMHWVTLVFVDIDIYQSEIQVVHPYIVGLSVVGGMCVFDPALQGAVLGPLLVTALATVGRRGLNSRLTQFESTTCHPT